MTDLVIRSNNASALLKSLISTEVANYAYEIAPSAPLISKQYSYITPTQQPPATPMSNGAEVTFNINKANLWRGLLIQTNFTLTTGVGDILTNHAGLSMFEWIEIRANSKCLFHFDDSYLLARTQQCKPGETVSIYAKAYPMVPGTYVAVAATDTARVCFTDLFSSFFEGPKLNFDLAFWEQMQVVCRFNTQIRAGFINPISSATMGAYVYTYQPDMSYWNKLRSMNCNPTRPLNMLTYSSIRQVNALTSATTTDLRMTCNNAVFNTYFYVRIATAADTTNAVATNWITPINTFTVTLGGYELLRSIPSVIANWEAEKSSGAGIFCTPTAGSTPVTVAKLKTTVNTLNWGLDRDRTTNSGALSFNDINTPTLTVNYTSNASFADYNLIVVHEFWQIATLDASNSTVAVTLAV